MSWCREDIVRGARLKGGVLRASVSGLTHIGLGVLVGSGLHEQAHTGGVTFEGGATQRGFSDLFFTCGPTQIASQAPSIGPKIIVHECV